MKGKCFGLTVLAAMTLFPAVHAQAAEISAKSAVVYEPYTETVLYEKAPDERMLIASTTKIMTAVIVLEHCALDEKVTVLPEHAAVEGSSMYLQPGGDYTVEEVLYGMMLASGNDAAAALADHCAGSMEDFAAMMNRKCGELGLQNTHFANSHGLDDPEQYSTARDLALITAYAMENRTFCRIFSTRSYTTHDITYLNHNRLLSTCEGCIGGKTGYTAAAGRILVSCAERDGMRLICVTVSDPSDWNDHAALYDELFGAYRYIPLPEQSWQRVEVISGTKGSAALRCSTDGVLVPKDTEARFNVRLPRFVYAPVLLGTEAGSADLYLDGGYDRTVEILFNESVTSDSSIPLTPWERFQRVWFLTCRYSGGVYYPI